MYGVDSCQRTRLKSNCRDLRTSITPLRMNSNETAIRMPEIGRSVIHTKGVELIQQWINAMNTKDCTAP